MRKNMKTNILISLIFAAGLTVLSGCGAVNETADGKKTSETTGNPEPETRSELILKNHRMDKTIEVKSGAVATYADQTESGKVTRHLVCLANFEMDLAKVQKWMDLHSIQVSDEEQIKVCFTLNGEKDFAESNQLKVQTYPMADTRVFQPDTISHNAISVRKKGDYIVHVPDKTKGEVKIISVTDEKVSGEVILSEGDKSIRGGFTAANLKGR